MTWPVEDIPDEDDVFMRVLRLHCERGRIEDGAFVDRGDGMSIDWEKYASPHQTRKGNKAKGPSEYAVIRLNAGKVRRETRKASPIEVQHSPIQRSPEDPIGNRAHGDLLGLHGLSKGDRNEVRVILRRLAAIEIPLDAPVVE